MPPEPTPELEITVSSEYLADLNARANAQYRIEDGVAELAARNPFDAFVYLGTAAIASFMQAGQIESTIIRHEGFEEHILEVFPKGADTDEPDYEQPIFKSVSRRANMAQLPVRVQIRVQDPADNVGRLSKPRDFLSFLAPRQDAGKDQ